MTTARQNWLDNIRWQSDFYLRGAKRERTDPEFEWEWYANFSLGRGGGAKMLAKRALSRLPVQSRWNPPPSYPIGWVEQNVGLLWGARALLEDDLSKLLFDTQMVLRATGYGHFYFPRIDFEDFVTVVEETSFGSADLPSDYLGLPLRVFSLKVPGCAAAPDLKIVSTGAQVRLLNSYRQYLVRRDGIDTSPSAGDVVLDCGACIGEISLLFAGLVGGTGEVHLFDPIPLHARYCALQGKLNPSLEHVLHINTLAVGDATRDVSGTRADSGAIAPGGLAIDSFAMTTLDDYVASKKLRKVDVIKMDIEGAEKAALAGAGHVVREFCPTLTISAYHLSDDLWEIPDRIKSLNPSYKLYFGHHSPVSLESVYYAVEPR